MLENRAYILGRRSYPGAEPLRCEADVEAVAAAKAADGATEIFGKANAR